MLEKPDISDQQIISSLHLDYEIDVSNVSFLPLGYDVNTAVYKVSGRHKKTYFLKLRKGKFEPLAVEIPHFLAKLGIGAILSPLGTRKGDLFGSLDDQGVKYTMILYPYIHGNDGYQVRLTDSHWIQLGKTFTSIHAIQLPPNFARQVPCEAYNPRWREDVKRFQAQVHKKTYPDPTANKLADFIRYKRNEISRMVGRAEELAIVLKQSPLEFVLCHSDAHPGNFLITDPGEIYLVDWDNPIFAPKERDLMFFGGGMSGDLPGGREENLFFEGYGGVDINRLALVYYRYERIIQDIAEFCKQLLATTSGGEDREQAYIYFTESFKPGRVVEAAIQTEQLMSKEVG